MARQALARKLALRIGLAARVLPDTDVKRLLGVLVDRIGLPLRDTDIAALTVEDLRTAHHGEFKEVEQPLLETALALLKGDYRDVTPTAPVIQPYQDGDMPASIRIGFASDNLSNVNGHFGSCRQFLVYQVSPSDARLIDIRSTRAIAASAPEDKNAVRARLVADCHVLYVGSVGGPAAAKLVREGVHTLKMPEGDAIADIIKQFQNVMADNPPPWLAKRMGVGAKHRARFEMEDSG